MNNNGLTTQKCVLIIVAISGVVVSYGIHTFTHPSVNGMALASVLGVIGLLAGLSYKELQDIRRSK